MLDIKYDYKVDDFTNPMTLKGTIDYNKPDEDSKYGGETFLLNYQNFVLIFLFSDSTGTVTGVETADIPSGGSIMKTKPFHITIPYDPTYLYVVVNYHFTA